RRAVYFPRSQQHRDAAAGVGVGGGVEGAPVRGDEVELAVVVEVGRDHSLRACADRVEAERADAGQVASFERLQPCTVGGEFACIVACESMTMSRGWLAVSQPGKEPHVASPFETGLRSKDNASASGAQTERRGEAWPVRDLPGGATSPAAWFQESAR